MTEVKAPDPRTPEAIRKQVQRDREEAMGIERREVKQSWRERGMADFCAYVRGGESPYAFNEYVNTLIRRDYEKLRAELVELQAMTCQQCKRSLPTECAGRFPGEATCWKLRGGFDLML
ncbi:hypothetical protein IAI52_27855 [Pseudomonas lurida]|uniref:hypothetical protein n=1 Tax=Pseudomonas lurida TaxID=244566 RepID=UPI0016574942|nr:hypothetical protein [Pseudomonas lurida]MBC8984066.1 hypothetical protein [Pseudomonas lurida]